VLIYLYAYKVNVKKEMANKEVNPIWFSGIVIYGIFWFVKK
jgi:hypothetical protein